MADETDKVNRFRRNDVATANGVDAMKPMMLFLISMLRMWAHSIDRFAVNCERALDETRRGNQ
jgi:hypothetical protein